MTLILNNDDVKQVLTMEITMNALDQAYRELTRKQAVCRPRIDMQIPTTDPNKIYQWGTMEGGSMSGYFAIRMKSDVIYEQEYLGAITQEKYCVQPGRFCGLILLNSIENGEPLALINDGYLQHMRVGADSGIGAKYIARGEAEVVGMIGSGGMARSHVESFLLARKIKKIQVYSPTKENREAYAKEISDKYGLEVVPVNNPRDAYKGAHIVAGCTDSSVPIIYGKWLEEGTHVTCVGGKPDDDTLKRIDVSLRLGNAPHPWGLPEFGLADEYLTYAARPNENADFQMKRAGQRGHGVIAEDRAVFLEELLSGKKKGRTSDKQITYSERGNIQGAQFFAVAGKVYELAKERGLGREIPTEWFLQDIRD
ncbi:MAG TPA: ornithine cyclodeaminase family protein [Candidatus Binatia bacterium]|jgi:ornithine cyclodeaminase/alanine dehydrogenase-like protein (mu-crystallin family)|nr:ornithine cyclodeaminase family protein [Candidatus Binatia bacterium]